MILLFLSAGISFPFPYYSGVTDTLEFTPLLSFLSNSKLSAVPLARQDYPMIYSTRFFTYGNEDKMRESEVDYFAI